MEKATDVELYKAVEYLKTQGYTIQRKPLGDRGEWIVRYPLGCGAPPYTQHNDMESAISAAAAHHASTKLNPKP